MLPLADDNPTRLPPTVNYIIIAASTVIFLWQASSTPDHFVSTLFTYGLIPTQITAGKNLHTIITNQFLHGGWTHLAGNMLFLWIFGDNIEDNIVCRSSSKWVGRLVYLGFYLLCGTVASLTWMVTAWGSTIPAVGASGSIAGVLGAYFIFYPNRMVRTLFSFGFFFRVIWVKAYTMIGFWFLYQFLMAFLPINSGVAFWAHVGGFVVGVILTRIYMPRPRVIQTYYGLQARMGLSDDIRVYVVRHFFRHAREHRLERIIISSGEVHNAMGLISRMPSVCNALRSRELERLGDVTLLEEYRNPGVKNNSSTNRYEYQLQGARADDPSKSSDCEVSGNY